LRYLCVMSVPISPKVLLHRSGDAVRVRPVTVDDCTRRYEAWLADPRVNRFLETRWQPQTGQAILEFVRQAIASDSGHLLAIVELSSGRHIGNIKIGAINERHRSADVSYFIGEVDCWGKGYGSEAVGLAVRLAFEELGLFRLQAGVYSSNVASIRVLVRNGFVQEGCWRQALVTQEPMRDDHLWFGLMRDEWARLSQQAQSDGR